MSVLKEFTNVMASAGERKSGDYSFQWKKFRKSGNFNGVAETTPQLRFFIGQKTVPLDFLSNTVRLKKDEGFVPPFSNRQSGCTGWAHGSGDLSELRAIRPYLLNLKNSKTEPTSPGTTFPA